MTIAPIRRSVRVGAPPDRAFELFVGAMGRWWAPGRTPAAKPHADIVVERRAGGRWFERSADGEETQWGEVTAIDPPRRLLLAWKLDRDFKFDPTFSTEVEFQFEPEGGGTRVTLEHRQLERFGADAERLAKSIGAGWPAMLGRYVDFTNPVIVHGIPGSPFMRAVLATLEEKGASWRLRALAPGQHKLPAHMGLHPFGRVPAIEHGDFRLYETQAIVRYADRLRPEPALTPATARAEARMNQAMGVLDWYYFPASVAIVFPRVVAPALGLPADLSGVEAAMPKVTVSLSALAEILGEQEFLAGEALSLADLYLAPHLDMLTGAPEGETLLQPHVALRAWLARVLSRPSLAATTWDAVTALAKAA